MKTLFYTLAVFLFPFLGNSTNSDTTLTRDNCNRLLKEMTADLATQLIDNGQLFFFINESQIPQNSLGQVKEILLQLEVDAGIKFMFVNLEDDVKVTNGLVLYTSLLSKHLKKENSSWQERFYNTAFSLSNKYKNLDFIREVGIFYFQEARLLLALHSDPFQINSQYKFLGVGTFMFSLQNEKKGIYYLKVGIDACPFIKKLKN